MVAGCGSVDSEVRDLYGRAHAARSHARALCGRLNAANGEAAKMLRLIRATIDRVDQVGDVRLAVSPGAAQRRNTACARLRAELASMPVIEQAKGIVMALRGWPADQALDALRQASQEKSITLQEMAERIVALPQRSGHVPAQPGGSAAWSVPDLCP